MKEILATVTAQLLDVLKLALLVTLTAAGRQLTAYLVVHAKNLETKTALMLLDDVVAAATDSVEQTVVANMREGGEGLAPVEAGKAKRAALELIWARFGVSGLSRMMAILGIEKSGTMDAFLAAKIEARVLKGKSSTAKAAA